MKRSEEFLAAMDAYDGGDVKWAVELMEKCAQQGDPVACFTAALWYRDEDVVHDLDRSHHWLERLRELAGAGDPEAQWELGQHYRFGNLVPKDVEQANYWLELSAAAGCAEAQHHLAWFLETGQYDYPRDRERSEDWYQRAFQQEHPETLYTYAIRQLRDGQATPQALALLTRASEKGLKQAADLLRSLVH